jgi:hypothetical protein
MKRKLIAGLFICLTLGPVSAYCLGISDIFQLLAIYNEIHAYKEMYDQYAAIIRHPGSIFNAVDASIQLGEMTTAGTSAGQRIEVLRGAVNAAHTIMTEMHGMQVLSSSNAAAYGSLLSQTQQMSQELQALERQSATDINRTRYADQSFASNSQIARAHRWQ